MMDGAIDIFKIQMDMNELYFSPWEFENKFLKLANFYLH